MAPNAYHIWAHLRTWSKNQFTLFIHVVKEAGQLVRQRVGSGCRFIKQTLAVTSAVESRKIQTVRAVMRRGCQRVQTKVKAMPPF